MWLCFAAVHGPAVLHRIEEVEPWGSRCAGVPSSWWPGWPSWRGSRPAYPQHAHAERPPPTVQIVGISALSDDKSVGLRDLYVADPGPDGYQPGSAAPLAMQVWNNTNAPVSLVSAAASGAVPVVLVGQGSVDPASTVPPTSATFDVVVGPSGNIPLSQAAGRYLQIGCVLDQPQVGHGGRGDVHLQQRRDHHHQRPGRPAVAGRPGRARRPHRRLLRSTPPPQLRGSCGDGGGGLAEPFSPMRTVIARQPRSGAPSRSVQLAFAVMSGYVASRGSASHTSQRWPTGRMKTWRFAQ